MGPPKPRWISLSACLLRAITLGDWVVRYAHTGLVGVMEPVLARIFAITIAKEYAIPTLTGWLVKAMRQMLQIAPPGRSSSSPFIEFHGQGGLHPEDPVPGWNDSGGRRTGGFHCTIGGPGA